MLFLGHRSVGLVYVWGSNLKLGGRHLVLFLGVGVVIGAGAGVVVT